MNRKTGATQSVKFFGSLDEPERVFAPSQGTMVVLEVEKILQGNRSVNLLHRGEVYRLQVTKQGKLLLTK